MSINTANINDTFFEGVYKDVWKKLIPPGLTEAEVDFITDIASLKKGDRVLDLMCGYGRHALELGKRGFEVTAIDNLKEYIVEIEQKAGESGLPVTPVLTGALEAELKGEFDAAICMGNSFAFFNRDEGITLLKKISAHLKPNGIFLINSWMIAEIAIKYFKERDWMQVGEFKYLLDYKFCFQPNRIESEQTILAQDGTKEVIHGVDYIFTLDELETMFREAGLKTRELFGTPRKKKFTMGDGRIYIIAEKMD